MKVAFSGGRTSQEGKGRKGTGREGKGWEGTDGGRKGIGRDGKKKIEIVWHRGIFIGFCDGAMKLIPSSFPKMYNPGYCMR